MSRPATSAAVSSGDRSVSVPAWGVVGRTSCSRPVRYSRCERVRNSRAIDFLLCRYRSAASRWPRHSRVTEAFARLLHWGHMHPDLMPLQHVDELRRLIAESESRPVLVFKHSHTCGVSWEAL